MCSGEFRGFLPEVKKLSVEEFIPKVSPKAGSLGIALVAWTTSSRLLLHQALSVHSTIQGSFRVISFIGLPSFGLTVEYLAS